MNASSKKNFLLTILALIFTAGLTFASIELPQLLDTFLDTHIDTLDVATGLNQLSDYKTELYLKYLHLRWIGYGCLAFIVILMIIGFVTEKSGWTAAGAFVLFLPVFGHFAATMFFLGGLGFLRLLWLPLLDVSFDLFRLGEIVNLPYDALTHIWSFAGFDYWVNPSYVITGSGLLIFFLGTLTWFYARTQKKELADFWVYRLSRHPQYLGWIVWSYGVMFLPGSNIRLSYRLSNSLPWLLSTMIILGVAMLEELKMTRILGETYESYRRRVPFLFPLPRFIVWLFTLLLQLMFKKEHLERKREIVAVLTFYTVLCLAISAMYGGLVSLSERITEASKQQIEKLAHVLKYADNFGEKRRAAGELEQIGEPAMETLLALLSDDVPQVRAYSASALGSMNPERVVPPLTALLYDTDSYVRRSAVGALGRTGSEKAIQPLVQAFTDKTRGMTVAAAGALGEIRHPDVIPPLIEALGDTALKATRAAATALGNLDAKEAIGPLVQCFEKTPDCPYDVVGAALWKLGSERAVDAWIVGLKKGSWWYTRASCAGALGDNKLAKGIEPLREALRDESKQVRRAAVLALMEFRSEGTTEALQGALADEDFEVRTYAEEGLKKIGATDSVSAIEKQK
jgi:HEAT repeat protein/protein-S-isoprenylcysteine O-methyltransferase Ste14